MYRTELEHLFHSLNFILYFNKHWCRVSNESCHIHNNNNTTILVNDSCATALREHHRKGWEFTLTSQVKL